MRIGELAERAGTSARTLRYYEQQGLLDTRRDASGYRDFDEVDLRLVKEIRSLLEIGFNLEDARPFVECLRAGHGSGAECPASIEVLRRKLADLDSCIARLSQVRERVGQELAAAEGREPAVEGREPSTGGRVPAVEGGDTAVAAAGRGLTVACREFTVEERNGT